jgi:hypothetical protein
MSLNHYRKIPILFQENINKLISTKLNDENEKIIKKVKCR